jgi:hypothetical protein
VKQLPEASREELRAVEVAAANQRRLVVNLW